MKNNVSILAVGCEIRRYCHMQTMSAGSSGKQCRLSSGI